MMLMMYGSNMYGSNRSKASVLSLRLHPVARFQALAGVELVAMHVNHLPAQIEHMCTWVSAVQYESRGAATLLEAMLSGSLLPLPGASLQTRQSCDVCLLIRLCFFATGRLLQANGFDEPMVLDAATHHQAQPGSHEQWPGLEMQVLVASKPRLWTAGAAPADTAGDVEMCAENVTAWFTKVSRCISGGRLQEAALALLPFCTCDACLDCIFCEMMGAMCPQQWALPAVGH